MKVLKALRTSSAPVQHHLLNDAGDGSTYSEAHRLYHPIFSRYLVEFGYYDIFLVDAETGHIVYTVFKEVDYGTSLLTGPYMNTNFADAFRAARDANSQDFSLLVDFEPYPPSYDAPAAFIASPIYDGAERIGVLVFQMPIDRINDVMTNNYGCHSCAWQRDDELLITIEDDGIPFNPFSTEPPDTSLTLEDRPIGGVGIHLVRNVMDRFHYQRRAKRNIVTLKKRIGAT